jgi:hypothetical protein
MLIFAQEMPVGPGLECFAAVLLGVMAIGLVLLGFFLGRMSGRSKDHNDNDQLHGARATTTPGEKGKKQCGRCGAIVNVYAVRCEECRAVFVEKVL